MRLSVPGDAREDLLALVSHSDCRVVERLDSDVSNAPHVLLQLGSRLALEQLRHEGGSALP